MRFELEVDTEGAMGAGEVPHGDAQVLGECHAGATGRLLARRLADGSDDPWDARDWLPR